MDKIVLNNPITELPFRVVSANWQASDNKLTVNIEMVDSNTGEILVSRNYFIPLPDRSLENTIKAILKPAAETNPQYQLILSEPESE